MAGIIDLFNLQIPKCVVLPASNGKSITKGDQAVIAGEATGGNDFNGFPYLHVKSNGELICMYVHVFGHGSSSNDELSGTYFRRSNDGGLTWGDPEIVFLTQSRPAEIEGMSSMVNMTISPTDRMISFPYDESAFTGARVPYVTYSDDEFETFLQAYKLSDAYDGDNKQADGTGTGFFVGSNIYKGLYGRTSGVGNRYGQVFRSQNNGGSFEFLANIGKAGSFDYEETCFAIHPLGFVVAAQRTDTTKEVHISYGASGSDWSAPKDVGIDSWGRPAFAFSPSGTALMVGRHSTDQRTIYIWSNDCFQTVQWDYVNENVYYNTYGDVKWVDDRFVMVWSDDENNPTGPAKIYRGFFTET